MSLRDQDQAVLRALLAGELDADERQAFEGMQAWLDENARGTLSAKQRAWARDRANQLELDWEDPTERNRNVPRGKEVAPLWDQRLPLSPPGRKAR